MYVRYLFKQGGDVDHTTHSVSVPCKWVIYFLLGRVLSGSLPRICSNYLIPLQLGTAWGFGKLHIPFLTPGCFMAVHYAFVLVCVAEISPK